MTDPWDAHAEWWQREFTEGADPEYTEQILPLVAAHLEGVAVLVDVGCGEGQVARTARAAGVERVVGVDPARSQVAVARGRSGGAHYLQGAVGMLGVASASADAAVVCLVLEHVADLEGALGELARIVRPGGRLLLLLNHPLLQTPDSGWIDDQVLDPPEQYWRVGAYLDEAVTTEQVERGVFIEFHHRPLSQYLNTARSVGFVLEHMAEPPPPPGFLARAEEYLAARSIPRLMFLRFTRSR